MVPYSAAVERASGQTRRGQCVTRGYRGGQQRAWQRPPHSLQSACARGGQALGCRPEAPCGGGGGGLAGAVGGGGVWQGRLGGGGLGGAIGGGGLGGAVWGGGSGRGDWGVHIVQRVHPHAPRSRSPIRLHGRTGPFSKTVACTEGDGRGARGALPRRGLRPRAMGPEADGGAQDRPNKGPGVEDSAAAGPREAKGDGGCRGRGSPAPPIGTLRVRRGTAQPPKRGMPPGGAPDRPPAAPGRATSSRRRDSRRAPRTERRAVARAHNAAGGTKRRNKCGASVAYKTIPPAPPNVRPVPPPPHGMGGGRSPSVTQRTVFFGARHATSVWQRNPFSIGTGPAP